MQVAHITTRDAVIGNNSNIATCFGIWANMTVAPADIELSLAK
jgi:hypothetical protein